MVFKGVSHNCLFVFVDAAVRIVELPKIAATDSLLLDGYNKNQNQEDLETGGAEKRKLEQLSSDGEKSRKKPKVDDLSQSAGTATELSPREKQDEPLTEAKEKGGEKSLEDVIRDNIESSDNLVSHTENHLDITNSGLTTRPDTEKKKKKRKKRSKDDINQSSATTSSRDATVNEIDGGVPANVDASPHSLPSSNLDHSSSAEARQKENDMVENVVEDVGRDKTETDNLMESHLDTSSGLTARPDTEKNKSTSKDDVNQSLAAAAALTTSRDIVNEINRVPANVDYVDDSFESLLVPREENPFVEAASQKGNFKNEIFVEDVGRNNIEPNSVGLMATRPDKSSKDDINQSFPAATGSKGLVTEINGVAGNEDPVGGATLISLSISTRRENLGTPYA
ncbi:unnamed protein product [Eruca vesicaria subsp. sativa]|uniref:Uncharacterized protein n=1 Tax=Eruca vesicaria subsp. sativa TaxID=29727 RepID=A0ABC8KXZ4_ERUVS|nr:unnamed protein product [Eruca vesicaria subsp. sativa]